MIVRMLFILVLLTSLGCGQTWIPRALTWDYNYSSNDSLNIEFDVFQGWGMLDTAYVVLDSTQVHELDLLQYGLNDNSFRYFYCRARRLSDGAISFNSDTIYAWFPIILDNTPYQFKVLKMKLE